MHAQGHNLPLTCPAAPRADNQAHNKAPHMSCCSSTRSRSGSGPSTRCTRNSMRATASSRVSNARVNPAMKSLPPTTWGTGWGGGRGR